MRGLYSEIIGSQQTSNYEKSFLRSWGPKLLLAIVAFGLLTLFIQLSQATSYAQAACRGWNQVPGEENMCWRINTQTNGRGAEAVANYEFSNRGIGEKTITVVLKRERFWCSDVPPGSNGAATICNSNGRVDSDITLTIPPSESRSSGDLRQAVGNNGRCGSAQVDYWIKSVDGRGLNAGPYWAVAFLDSCRVSPPPAPPPPPPPAKHRECVNQACMTLDGGGANKCNVDADCRVVTHYACEGLSCVLKQGPGQNQCRVNTNDCVPVKHRVCENRACKTVLGAGRNECVVDDDCKERRTHLECRNEACRKVSGGGDDRCVSDSECRPVKNQNVICDSLSVNPQSGVRPLAVWASLSGHTEQGPSRPARAEAGGSVVSYKFNFGDGTGDLMQSGQNLSHTYNAVGTFVVNGYAIDDRNNQAGGSGSCQKVVTVSAVGVTPPPPTGKVLGAIPSTGAEMALIPVLFGTGGIGWFVRKLKAGKD